MVFQGLAGLFRGISQGRKHKTSATKKHMFKKNVFINQLIFFYSVYTQYIRLSMLTHLTSEDRDQSASTHH